MSQEIIKKNPEKYQMKLNKKNNPAEKIRYVINEYAYFPPYWLDDVMDDSQREKAKKLVQMIKKNHQQPSQVANLTKDQILAKLNEQINKEAKAKRSKEEKDQEMLEHPIVQIFNCPQPYFSLEQLVGHYYICASDDKFDTIDGKLGKKIKLNKIPFKLGHLKYLIKEQIKLWNKLIPQTEEYIIDLLERNFWKRKEAAFYAGLMRDAPLLPILGSLMDLWFYPMLGHVETSLNLEIFLVLFKKAWTIEKTMAKELLNKDSQTIINGILNPKSKMQSTYPWIQFNSLQSHIKITLKNLGHIEHIPLGKAIMDFYKKYHSFLPRIVLSFARFGAIGELTENFFENLSFKINDQQINLEKFPEIKYFMTYLKKLKRLLSKYQVEIKAVIINKKAPCYNALTFLLECFTIRPALQGMVYWNRFEEVPDFEKLFALALASEISYLKTLTSLPLKSFASWFLTTRYLL